MGKGGGGGHTPVEAKETGRSKQLIKIVEIISEGEIEGLADGLKSVYFNNTPVQNKDGSFNFNNVQIEGRVGSQVQDVIAGFNTSEKEISVGTQVKKNLPITRTVTDDKVSRLRLTIGVQSLFKQEENGDTNGAKVDLIITIGSRTYPVTINGKYSSQYLQQHTFDNLPPVPFTVKVERVTEDSQTQRLQNGTIWSSYTEIIDTEFTYPNTALIGVKFDSEQFSSIPTRTYDVLGIKVQVPSNYDPYTRQYTGMWDGTFKLSWTDNPAWVLYDIIIHKRYGTGWEDLPAFTADKWTLYQIAQYCDQLVPDGFGGQEPRFTCNLYKTEQSLAYEFFSNLCSIFRAVQVWQGQQLTFIMDRPADPVWTYTNANVEKGEFNYTYSAKKSRHNAIQVEYADKDNAYERAIEYVSDDESIRKNGLNVKKITAFGCTSRGQAHRTGLWLLQTEKLETKTVSFTVGAEGLMHVPGDIIKVADTYYAGTNVGGRVLSVNGKKVTLDREISVNGNSYFSYINAQAKHQDIKIVSAKGAEVTLDQEPAGLEAYGVWSLSTQQVTSQLFKAISVKEETKGKYTITALQHEPQKEAIVDNGAKFEPKATSILTVPQVSNIGVTVNPDGSISFAGDVTGGNGVIKYDFRIYKDGALYDIRLGQTSPNLNLDGLENGEYTVVILVKNERGQVLSERTQTFVIDKPPAPTGVRVTGGLGNITIEWDWINDATATEIFVSETDDIKTATRLTKVTARMYTHEVGAKKVRYYWLRHTRGVNVGPFSQQSGLRGESSVDIDAELEILNKKLSQNIVDEVIDTALPARNLDLIKTVNGLNADEYQGHKQVYNTADGKLYTWNGSKYLENGIDASGIRIKTTQLVGTLQADQVGANTIGAGALQAGAVRAEHMAAGQITADKMAIGLGGNILYNPIFSNNAYGWGGFNRRIGDWSNCPATNTFGRGYHKDNYHPKGERTEEWRVVTITGTQEQFNTLSHRGAYLDVCSQFINVVAGKWYIASAYVGGFNCAGSIVIDKYNSEENQHQGIIAESAISGHDNVYNKPSNFINAYTGAFANGHVGDANRIFVKFKAPDTGKILLVFRLSRYAINQTYADFFIARAMLQECTEYAIAPSPWQNTGVTAIHGGSIVTNSITAQQMAADSITSNKIATGAVAAKHIAVGSIGAEHIATRSLTSDKLNVNSLSAISTNIGSINAGDITGVNIHGNNINGNNISGGAINGTTITGSTINGNDINGGTIRGARLEGVTGKFTGSLEVNQLIGGNLCETFIANAYIVAGSYQSRIRIAPSPVRRIFFVVNSHITFTVEANQSHEYYYWHTDKKDPTELFNIGFGNGNPAKLCIVAYAVSSTTTMTQV
ncbi:MAG: phage tail protein [Haemophilus parainfluenzae]|nr:phage tail protein [Haemophilus parainfluenzae]